MRTYITPSIIIIICIHTIVSHLSKSVPSLNLIPGPHLMQVVGQFVLNAVQCLRHNYVFRVNWSRNEALATGLGDWSRHNEILTVPKTEEWLQFDLVHLMSNGLKQPGKVRGRLVVERTQMFAKGQHHAERKNTLQYVSTQYSRVVKDNCGLIISVEVSEVHLHGIKGSTTLMTSLVVALADYYIRTNQSMSELLALLSSSLKHAYINNRTHKTHYRVHTKERERNAYLTPLETLIAGVTMSWR